MSQNTLDALNELRDFLFERVYVHEALLTEARRAEGVVARLFEYFSQYPQDMPTHFREGDGQDDVARRVADYIAGMTDGYAIQLFQEVFVPRVWPV